MGRTKASLGGTRKSCPTTPSPPGLASWGQEPTFSGVPASLGGAPPEARSATTPTCTAPGALGQVPRGGASVQASVQLLLSPQSRVLKQHVGERNFHAFYQVSQSRQGETCREGLLIAPPTVPFPPLSLCAIAPAPPLLQWELPGCGCVYTSSDSDVGSPWTQAGQCPHHV